MLFKLQSKFMQKGKVLALDYGKKRIGCASGDMSLKIAVPHGIIENKNLNFVISKILDFCNEWKVKMIVVGLPVSMDGNDSHITKCVREFVDKLKESISWVEVKLFDERLTSFEADNLMKSAGKTTKDKKEYRDCYAACVILQRFFDSIEK